MALRVGDTLLRQKLPILVAEFTQHENILTVSAVDGYPGRLSASYTVAAEGLDREQYPSTGGLAAVSHILETLGIHLLIGQEFSDCLREIMPDLFCWLPCWLLP